MWPLRRLLAVNMVLLAAVPAALVTWMLARGSTQAVEDLADKVLTQVAASVQNGTEAHVQQVRAVLDGLVRERMSPAELERTRQWLREPARYEAMAFALVRQSTDVTQVHLGNLRGEYLGVQAMANGARIAVRAPDGVGRQVFEVAAPGERGTPTVEAANWEPRSTPWYATAMNAKDRAFTPVRVTPERRLLVSLAQPVFDADGGAAGVLAADLSLQHLADLIRTQRISARGAAFVVDEKGLLVASSAGDALADAEGRRTTPAASVNPVLRASFGALQALQAQRSADTVATNTQLQRLPLEGGAVLMVQRPFGESLGLRWTLVVAAPEADFTADIRRSQRQSLAAMAVLIALAALVGFVIAHGIGRRLRRLSVAAAQLGRGEVPAMDKGTRIAEVHALSKVLHDSGEQLQGFRAQVEADARALQEANDTLEERVVQRTAELAASREEALAAARAKAAFLATMSHEIRTPLNGVVGMGALLAETALDAEQRDYLETIRLSSDQLLAVINDVLDFSKIESGKLDLEIEPLSVRGAVEEACDIAAPRAREKGLELLIDIAEDVPAAVEGDVTRLRQVLINLVNNAVKFTERGEVAVHVRSHPGREAGRCELEFRVTDTGIGIPPERQDALFAAFTQVDASTTRKYGGTGLGLAICKRLVELMGGRIGLESEAGRGSTFWFTVDARTTALAPTLGVEHAGQLAGRRLLVIDDHVTNVRILARQLQLWGVEVATAHSGREALDLALAAPQPADVVVTDMHMPEMDGVELARRLKALPGWDAVPVVLLSSGFMPPADESARLFAARLLKPARQTQLFDALLRCVSGPQAARSAPTVAPGARKDAVVLVADDNAVNLKVACAMLARLGYGYEIAEDGREAIDAVAQAHAQGRRFAAVLMDVNMPEVDGLEATRQLHAAWGERSPPIIALTAGASAEDRARCEAAGMDDYLTKPLQVGALAQSLERWTQGGPAVTEVAPTVAAVAAEAAVDFSRLEEFREFDDEHLSTTREVIALFLADAPRRLAAIDAAVAAGDTHALATAAHALKGAASNIGAGVMQQLAASLEDAARESWPVDAAARAAALRGAWERTRSALEAWRP